MSIQYSLLKGRLHNLVVLAILILCLSADSCSQCKNPSNNEESSTKKVVVQIVPLSSLSLVGNNKTIQCKLQQATNSAVADLAKLRLKVTPASTPASEANKIAYQGAAVDELTGEQIGLDKTFELTINPTAATEEIAVTLQAVYEGNEIGDPQTFIWKKDKTPAKVAVQIVPLTSLTLVGGDKLIQCKLQQATNSAVVDLAKLRLKVTAASTPASEDNKIVYQGVPVNELTGEQIGLDKTFELTINPTAATEKVVVTLQVFYDGKPLKGPNSSQNFTWEKKMNDVTEKLRKAITTDNNKEEALALLEQGNIQTGTKTDWGHTLLHESIAHYNDLEVVEKLISLPGMDLNAKGGFPKEETPLELAITENKLETFKLLLTKGAQVQPGTTMLHQAMGKPMVPMIKYILDNYDNLKDSKDKDGNTPLHIAANNPALTNNAGFPKLVVSLLKLGADPSITNNAGQTPKERAIANPNKSSDLIPAFEGTYNQSL